MNTIAIDCGASFLKGALFRGDDMVCQLEMPSTAVHGEEDVLEIVQIEKLIIQVQKLIFELSRNEKEVKLCLSNEMHGFILANEDGSPYTDYISWQKEYGNIAIQGTPSVDILREEKYSSDIYYSGMGLRGGLPSANLLYLLRKGYINNTSKYKFYTLGDYILFRLTGKEPICHPTNAAATGLFDFRKNSWNSSLIALYGHNICFPKIGHDPMQFTTGNCLYNCLPAIGDQQAALLGSDFTDKTDISFNLGTGAQVSCLVDTFERGDNPGVQIRPYFGKRLLRTMPHLPSGRAINVYIRFLKSVFNAYGFEIEDKTIWDIILSEIEKASPSNLSIDMSFFQNPLTQETRGSITNISEYSFTFGSLMNAVVRQMAANFLNAAHIIQPEKNKVKRIVFSGGVARKNDYLRKLIRAEYGISIPSVVAKDETLIGLNAYGKITS